MDTFLGVYGYMIVILFGVLFALSLFVWYEQQHKAPKEDDFKDKDKFKVATKKHKRNKVVCLALATVFFLLALTTVILPQTNSKIGDARQSYITQHYVRYTYSHKVVLHKGNEYYYNNGDGVLRKVSSSNFSKFQFKKANDDKSGKDAYLTFEEYTRNSRAGNFLTDLEDTLNPPVSTVTLHE